MIAILRRLALAGACLLGWSQVHAGCVIGVPHPTVYVGAASDAKCNYTKIQDAITAVSTSATCPPNIVISNKSGNAAWNEALTITDRSLALIGSTNSCSVNNTGPVAGAPDTVTAPAAVTTPQAIISGAGLNAPVITITGNSNVTVQGLEITGGSIGSDSEGGGIYYNGNGSLTLNATTVEYNHAGYGAGIDVSPTGSATLTLQANTLIVNNTADTSGGGIRIEGNTQLVAVADQTLIGFNTATSTYGGGLEVIGPARADIGSPGYGSAGVISNNTGAYGGGIAVLATQGGFNDGIVQLFTTVAERPVNIQGNIATKDGGAMYLRPHDGSSTSFATLCAFDFRFEDNTAPEGAALYLDWDTAFAYPDWGADASFNLYVTDGGSYCGSIFPGDFGAVSCAADAPCNDFSGNHTPLDAHGDPTTDGATIFVGHFSFLRGRAVSMRANNAAHGIRLSGDGNTYSNLSSSLIANNQFSQDVVTSQNSKAGFENCTIAHNLTAFGHVLSIDSDTSLALTEDIIDELGSFALDQPGDASVSAAYVLSSDITTLPSGPTIIQYNDFSGDPLFADAANGNFHLVAYTQNNLLHAARAIDFAPVLENDPTDDLDGHPYGVDVPAVPDAYGTRDLGAFEAVPITDRVFADGFGDRISLLY